MKGRAISGKDRKFVVIVVRSTCRVVKEMLANDRLMELPRATVGFATARKPFSVGGDGRECGDVLLNALVDVETCGQRTFYHSGTQIGKQDCCIDGKATRLFW